MSVDISEFETTRSANRLDIALRVLTSAVVHRERPRDVDAQCLRAMAGDDAERELPLHVLAVRIAQREIEMLKFIRTEIHKQETDGFSYSDIRCGNDNIDASVRQRNASVTE
jgi:hypothetical protein